MGSVILFGFGFYRRGDVSTKGENPCSALQIRPGHSRALAACSRSQFSTQICSSNLLLWFIGVFFAQGMKGTKEEGNETRENT